MLNLPLVGREPQVYLLASADPELWRSVEEGLPGTATVVNVARSPDALLRAVEGTKQPDLILLDSLLPGVEIGKLLAALRAATNDLPILLMVDSAMAECSDWMQSGIIDDFVVRNYAPSSWEFRAEKAVRMRKLASELEHFREAAARENQCDRLTGVLNREALLVALFRETDRVQRSKGALSLILFDIDDFGHWNSRLGVNVCDALLCQVAERTSRLLRSYDLLGRVGKDEFLMGLPGCTSVDAVALAERLRMEVFAEPYHIRGDVMRLSACFGIAQSLGRSPVVVLREAEEALGLAQKTGPESIQFGRSMDQDPPPVAFVSSTSGEDLLAW